MQFTCGNSGCIFYCCLIHPPIDITRRQGKTKHLSFLQNRIWWQFLWWEFSELWHMFYLSVFVRILTSCSHRLDKLDPNLGWRGNEPKYKAVQCQALQGQGAGHPLELSKIGERNFVRKLKWYIYDIIWFFVESLWKVSLYKSNTKGRRFCFTFHPSLSSPSPETN